MDQISHFLERRITRLEKTEERAQSREEAALSEHFRVACACPPTTSIYVRAGNLWDVAFAWAGGSATGYFVQSLTCDFSDSSDIALGSFANADYFWGIILRLHLQNYVSSTPPFFSFTGAETEYASAVEAENSITNIAMADSPWGLQFPLCGVVLHNDGRTGISGAVLPVEPINRGNSYLFGDLRPRHYIAESGPD